jgi:steroid delta-isomerase-like uncharacterized protein
MIEIKEKLFLKQFIKEHIQAANQHDLEAFVNSYSQAATVYDPMYSEPLKGRDAIRKDEKEFIAAFPDMTFTLGEVMEGGDMVAFEVIARGTHKGPLTGPTGPIPATNRTINLPIAGFARIDEEGLIAEERRYYNVAGLMQQLGLMPG